MFNARKNIVCKAAEAVKQIWKFTGQEKNSQAYA